MAEAQYFLSTNCFVCRVGDHWIILNIARDRYLCVTHTDLSTIGDRLAGWKLFDGGDRYAATVSNAKINLLNALVSSGIITVDHTNGKPFTQFPNLERTRSIDPSPNAAAPRPLGVLIRMAIACFNVDIRLRATTFSNQIQRIHRRQQRWLPGQNHDSDRLTCLVRMFFKFRFLYPRPYLCLFDSLALLEFLAMHKFYPRLVIGVVPDPFEAHCWLQDGTVVINDDLESINKYTPIFSA